MANSFNEFCNDLIDKQVTVKTLLPGVSAIAGVLTAVAQDGLQIRRNKGDVVFVRTTAIATVEEYKEAQVTSVQLPR